MDDPRIGTKGGQAPRLTISGKPYRAGIPRRGVGGGKYVGVDVFPSVDVDSEIEEIKRGLAKAAKQKNNAKRTDIPDATPPDSEASG